MSSSQSPSPLGSGAEPPQRPSGASGPMWARVKKSGAHILRRGAWYPVYRQRSNGTLLLEVRREIVPMNLAFVDLSNEPPKTWSVVRRQPGEYGAIRASQANLTPTYLVCPKCHHRANLRAEAAEVSCEQCGGLYAVNWGETC